MEVTQKEMIETLRDHYQLPLIEIINLLKVPIAPKSLRDDYARSAMQSLVQTTTYKQPRWWFGKQSYLVADNMQIAEVAYQIADAMINERNKNASEKAQ